MFVLVRAPGRSRPAGTDGSARSFLSRATHHARRHASPALRWHNENRLDNSGTLTAAGATARPDNHERRESAGVSRHLRRTLSHSLYRLLQSRPQLIKSGAVGAWQRPYHHINCRQFRQYLCSRQLSHPPLHRIAIHRRVAEARHDHADPRAIQRGSEVSHLKQRGANSLPLNTYGLEVSFARQS